MTNYNANSSSKAKNPNTGIHISVVSILGLTIIGLVAYIIAIRKTKVRRI